MLSQRVAVEAQSAVVPGLVFGCVLVWLVDVPVRCFPIRHQPLLWKTFCFS